MHRDVTSVYNIIVLHNNIKRKEDDAEFVNGDVMLV